MSQFESPNTAMASLRTIVQTILSRLNKISTADGKIRSDGDGTFQTGVPKIHDHLGTGEGGSLIDGLVPNWLNITGSTPTVNDDSTLGYQRGSQWINNIIDQWYICVRATTGAAVWRAIGDSTTNLSLVTRRPRTQWRSERWMYRSRRGFFHSV